MPTPRAADVLSLNQVKGMVKYLTATGKPRDAALVAVAAGFGLRISDVLRLRWGDLVENGTVKETVRVRETKTGKIRILPVLPLVRTAVEAWYRASAPVDLEAPVFTGPTGRAITRQMAWKIIKRVATELGFAGVIAPHSLRKAFCTAVFDKTKDPVLTARITGHTNPAQLLRYIGRTPEAEAAVWRELTQLVRA